LKKKPSGSVLAVQSPQNIEAVRQSFIRSHRCSARRQSVAVGISDHSMRRILHKNLNFHLYKIVVVQNLSDHDMATHSMVAECLIGILSNDVIILMTDEAHFHSSGYVKNRIFAIGQKKIHSSSINDLFTVHM
jgi:hypothetical protein